jgi:hypothetical protein
MVQIAQKVERFLETYRRPDAGRWGGQGLHKATEGVVTRAPTSPVLKDPDGYRIAFIERR